MEAEPALTPRCGEPEERGDERAGAGRTDWGAGTRQRALPPPTPRRFGSYSSGPHFLLRRTKRSALARGAVGPGPGVAGCSLR